MKKFDPQEKEPGETWSLLDLRSIDPEEVRDPKSWINWPKNWWFSLGSGFSSSLQEKGHLFFELGGVFTNILFKKTCFTLKN